MAEQLYYVYPMYVRDNGENYYSNTTYFHYLKEAKMYAYKYCRAGRKREAYVTIAYSKDGDFSTRKEKTVGTMIGRRGEVFWEPYKGTEKKAYYGGTTTKRKKKTLPFGL